MARNRRVLKAKKRSLSDGVTVDMISASSNKTHRSALTQLNTNIGAVAGVTEKCRLWEGNMDPTFCVK